MSAGTKEYRNGRLYYVYPKTHKIPPPPEITEEMVSFSHKVGLTQASDRYNVPTYYLTKARNEHNLRKN